MLSGGLTLESIVNIAADLFLKSITVNAANDGIVFTTGTATDTSHDSTLELPMASF